MHLRIKVICFKRFKPQVCQIIVYHPIILTEPFVERPVVCEHLQPMHNRLLLRAGLFFAFTASTTEIKSNAMFDCEAIIWNPYIYKTTVAYPFKVKLNNCR